MKKQILLLLIVLVSSISITAQTGAKLTSSNKSQEMNFSSPFKENFNPGPGQSWWGYYNGDESYGDTGLEKPASYNCAIYIPYDSPLSPDPTIYAIRVYMVRKADFKNFKIWMSDTLPNNADEANIVCDNIGDANGGVNDFKFSKSHKIGQKGVYVGYSFTITNANTDANKWPIWIANSGLKKELQDLRYSFLIKTSDDKKWWYPYSANIGHLAIQVLAGDHFQANALSIVDVKSGVTALGGSVTVPITVKNMGSDGLQDFKYTITTDGVESQEHHVATEDKPIMALFDTERYRITLPAATVNGEKECIIKITQVNGKANEATQNTTYPVKLITVEKPSPRKTVMETYTSNSKGYCPLGIVANDSLAKMYPDSYIGIMVHDLDVMAANTEYYNVCVTLPNPWPWTDINRSQRVTGYYGSQYNDPQQRVTKLGVKDDYLASQAEVVEAAVEVKPEWTTIDSTTIKVNTDITFQYNTDKGNYALGYILVSDCLTGTGEEWGQVNDLVLLNGSHIFDWDKTMDSIFVKGDKLVMGLKFNGVVVDGFGVLKGLDNSISKNIKLGETQKHSYTINIASNSLIQKKSNLKVVALLINRNTGNIVNADQKRIINNDPMGIDETEVTNLKEVARYSIDGRILNAPQKGINIVKYSDGSTKKVLVK